MSSAVGKRSPATVTDLLAIPEDERYHEVIDGELVRKAMPTFEHGDAQSALASRIKGPFQRRPGGTLPGGWWIGTEVEIELAPSHVYRPDVVGWRRERVPERPRGTPISIRPDWICEVLSRSTAHVDMGNKRLGYHRAGVAHYWLVDPINGTLAVLEWTAAGYLVALVAGRGEKVRAAPFEAIEIDVSELLGDDEEPQAASEAAPEAPDEEPAR